MTDERVDAVLHRLDVGSNPDPAFVSATLAILRPRVRAARIQDLSRVGRFRRDLRIVVDRSVKPSVSRPIIVLGAIALLLLAMVAAAVLIGGAVKRTIPIHNGPLVVSIGGELRAMDTADGTSRPITLPGAQAEHVSRSPDGQLAAYWRSTADGDQLMVVGLDAQTPRRLAVEQTIWWNGCTDSWSPDSRYLAAAVIVDGERRILVADTITGSGSLLTPGGTLAHCPLYSPDGRWIAFTEETGSSRTLDIIGVDGTGMRVISGDLGGFDVSGPDTWSPDGKWIYFDAQRSGTGRIFRADVGRGTSFQLTTDTQFAVAPASSPDGTVIAFLVVRADAAGFDLYVADSDGSHARRILEHAVNDGWSADGRYILTRWTPTDQSGGLAVISPDGAGLRVVAPLDQGCPADTTQPCEVGWGQPRP